MTTQNNQLPTSTGPIVRTRDCSFDIWDTCETLRIYADRTVYRQPCRNYSGSNNWGLGHSVSRYTGNLHKQLLAILEQEIQDDEDYTDRLFLAVLQDNNSW